MPFRYIDNIATADAAFEAWGETLEDVFRSAAEATLQVMVDDLATVHPEQEVVVELHNSALDMLLLNFLNELVFYKDAKRLLLRVETFSITSRPYSQSLHALLRGEEIDYERHHLSADVKAVTLYRLKVEQTAEGWRATVVLDI